MNRSAGNRCSLSVFLPIYILCAVVFFISIAFGAEHINPVLLLTPERLRPYERIILFRIRLPRALLALLAGALLAGSGAVFQLFFRNALAEPGIMGISSGAVLGAVAAGLIGIKSLGPVTVQSAGAFAGALAASLIVTALAGKKTIFSETIALLLCGTALGTLYSSFSSIILLIHEKSLHGMFAWMLGSFNGKGWNDLFFIILPAFLAFGLLFYCARTLDLLSGGETVALSLGVEVRRLRLFVIMGGSLAVAAAVCAGGTIGFIGLIAPHIVRRLYGARSRTLVPLSMGWGALILLISDTIARTIAAPSEIPVGVVTSLLGAPFFVSLVLSGQGYYRE